MSAGSLEMQGVTLAAWTSLGLTNILRALYALNKWGQPALVMYIVIKPIPSTWLMGDIPPLGSYLIHNPRAV